MSRRLQRSPGRTAAGTDKRRRSRRFNGFPISLIVSRALRVIGTAAKLDMAVRRTHRKSNS